MLFALVLLLIYLVDFAMLAAATSLFARTHISQSYVLSPATSSPSTSAGLAPPVGHPPFNVGPWKVHFAIHKTTSKRVSVWSFDKRSPELERCGPSARERVLEILKAEVRVSFDVGGSLFTLLLGRRSGTIETSFYSRYVTRLICLTLSYEWPSMQKWLNLSKRRAPN